MGMRVLDARSLGKDQPISAPLPGPMCHVQGGHRQPKNTHSPANVPVCIPAKAKIDAELAKAEHFTEAALAN